MNSGRAARLRPAPRSPLAAPGKLSSSGCRGAHPRQRSTCAFGGPSPHSPGPGIQDGSWVAPESGAQNPLSPSMEQVSSIRPSQGARWREARGRLGAAGCGSNGSGSGGDRKVRKQGTGGCSAGTR